MEGRFKGLVVPEVELVKLRDDYCSAAICAHVRCEDCLYAFANDKQFKQWVKEGEVYD